MSMKSPDTFRSQKIPSIDGRNQKDFERLFTLRLIIARYGEMDVTKWWNTKGQLGSLGI